MAVKATKTVGRNELCPCGSELKAKWCHNSPEKMQACNAVANMFMSKLIVEERKKRGLEPYIYVCGSCGKGTDAPAILGVVTPQSVRKCPHCGGTDLKENVTPTTGKAEQGPEEKSNIILET
jgi:hypothetical protein